MSTDLNIETFYNDNNSECRDDVKYENRGGINGEGIAIEYLYSTYRVLYGVDG